jgi:tRNA uridine 5-carboxymethylaminomethyl modification enzyme
VFNTSQLLAHIPGLSTISSRTLARLGVETRYDAFLARQEADLQAFAADEEMLLDEGVDYQRVEGLSSEVRERLGKVRPASIVRITLQRYSTVLISMTQGAAKRMEGMTPSGVLALLKHAKAAHRRVRPDAAGLNAAMTA